MLIGHQKQWQFFKKSVELNRLSHAYLFCGQTQLGKKKVAQELASLLLGKTVQEKLHPDFIMVEPQGREIQISQIRELNWKLSLKPYSAPLKVAVIDGAHLMNKDSQNCFLKTLEEPKGSVLLILVTEYPEVLLPTILSRCEIIKFHPVEKKEIENYLRSQGAPDGKIKEIVQISQGRPGRCIDFFSDPRKLENQKKITSDLIKISKSDVTGRFQYAKILSQAPNLNEILNEWLFYFRNLLLNSSSVDSTSMTKTIRLIQDTNYLISTTNVNPRLALEILMLEL